MARPRKAPAFLVDATVYRNAKLAALPSDAARLGFFYAVLGQAKLADPIPGQFSSRLHFREVAGRFGRYLDDYLRVGILEVAPRLCARCKTRWQVPPKTGALVVHDWHEHQYDPRKIERQRLWDEEHRSSNGEVSDVVSDAQSDAQSDRVSDVVSDAHLARDRVPPRESNVERRTENESLQKEDRSSLVSPGSERPDVAALLDRGWPRVTKAQRVMLDEIADRHDQPSKGEAVGTWAASVIAESDNGADPLANVRAVDNAWQAERRAEIDAEEARYASEKAERERDAKSFAERVGPSLVRSVPKAGEDWFATHEKAKP